MDISITNLNKYLFDIKKDSERKKRADDLVSQNLTITEKIDGTKLTLVRTDKASPAYEENWIVSYKGSVLSAGEFSHITDKDRGDISKSSIGIGQYVVVFDHLKKINNKIKSIPSGMEFSIEFAQNKDTLTRTYSTTGGLFLRSYGKVDARVIGGTLHTVLTGEEVTDPDKVKQMASLLELQTFPIFFKGKLNKESISKYPEILKGMGQVDWTNSIDVIQKFSQYILTVPSTLGGKTEGVVLKLEDGRFFKIVQADQYDLGGERGEKKDLYRMDPQAATDYFQQIRSLIKKIVSEKQLQGKSAQEITTAVNQYVSANRSKLAKFIKSLIDLSGGKRNATMVMDDIHDTVRLVAGKGEIHGEGKSIGLIPIAGKPLHIGHWKLIERASKENDRVIVYTTDTDRAKKGEFPIKGSDFIKLWSDIFIPALPKNVKVKFVDSPVRSVMHEIGWFEQIATQDKAEVPTVRLYSDKDDVDSNFKDEDLKKYPAMLAAGKIEKVGVERSSTVNVSGTKMREFLQNGDKASFMEHLPPVSQADKETIWTTLMKNKPTTETNVYRSLAEAVINAMAKELDEGGWRTTSTQKTKITPTLVQKALEATEKLMNEFAAYSKLPKIIVKGPVGSSKYYKDDMNDPAATYGDVDIQIVLPSESNERADQLKTNKTYLPALREFLTTKTPSYVENNAEDKDFGVSYVLFKIGDDVVQVDLVISYTITADWVSSRTTPEKGLKGFVTGMLLSSLGEAMNLSLASTTNPYIINGKERVHLNHSTVFSDAVAWYAKKAGVASPKLEKMKGHQSLDQNDPSFKKKCETVVAIADALEANNVFASGALVSKSGHKFKSRDEFIHMVLSTFERMMEDAKTAKKLDKATDPNALAAVKKIGVDADRGISVARELIKESGQSVASIDPKTPKTVNGQPAQATTKLKIVDADGKDIHSKVSADIKELVYALNQSVGFWKKNNPYIENGFIFNGSSQYLMDPSKFNVLSKYKSSFGDIDVIIPKAKLEDLGRWLDSIDDNDVEWKPTTKNKVTKAFFYVGRTKSFHSIPDQLVSLWWYAPAKQIVQIDFEGDEMTLDPNGYEKPSEWTKFTKDSPWDDLEKGIKGLAGALLLRSLARGTTALDNAVVLTPTAVKKVMAGAKEISDKDVTKNARHAMPSMYTLNTGGGLSGMRKAYKPLGAVMLNGKKVNAFAEQDSKDTPADQRTADIDQIFQIFFGGKPTAQERASFRSFQGILATMKRHLKPDAVARTMEKFKQNIEAEHLSDQEKQAIQTAVDQTLGSKYKVW